MTGIDIGHCLPPIWPRPPRPPVPEPEPDSLDAQVDWMTYSHPELYDMVHSGIDLTGAMAVSAKWARLGDELADIGQELSRLLSTTAQAWEGETADLAKESVAALADWSSETGTLATEVSGCITIQVDNVATARNAMPKPPYPYLPMPMPTPTPLPMPMPRPLPMPVVPSQASAFTSGEFGVAAPLVADSMVYTSRERALHQQAAETMATFQTNSRDVYATVPQFAPPDLRKMPFGDPPPLPPQPQPPTPNPQPPVPSPFVGGPGGGGPGGGSGGSGAAPGPGRAAGPGTPLAPGAGSGAGASEQTGTRPAAAAAARGGAPVAGAPMGGMPMGGASSGADDTERKGKYLQKDADLWGVDERVMPPVIGEANRRA